MKRARKLDRWYKPKLSEQTETKYVRIKSHPNYHTARWTREAKEFKVTHPLCERCKKKGIVQEAQVVDHIVPVPICEDFWDRTNWQSLCQKCNIEKGNKDKRLINDRRRNNKRS